VTGFDTGWATYALVAIALLAVASTLGLLRGSPLGSEIGAIEELFRATVNEKLGFSRLKAKVLFSDFRLDRFASRVSGKAIYPVSAVKISVNQYEAYFLWAYSSTLQPEPLVRRLGFMKLKSFLEIKGNSFRRPFQATL
jgi:hypothetical protein